MKKKQSKVIRKVNDLPSNLRNLKKIEIKCSGLQEIKYKIKELLFDGVADGFIKYRPSEYVQYELNFLDKSIVIIGHKSLIKLILQERK